MSIERITWDKSVDDRGGGNFALLSQRGRNVDCLLYPDGVTLDGEVFSHGTRKDSGLLTGHPCRINVHNSRTPLRIERPDGTSFMLRPIQPNTVKAVIAGSTASYADFWPGIDVVRAVAPGGLDDTLTVRTSNGQRAVSWQVIGDCRMVAPPSYESGFFTRTLVPYTFDGSTLTLDLSSVPLGKAVDIWLR